MYTGIIQAVGTIQQIEEKEHLRTFYILFPDHVREHIQTGASISIDGVCLTAVKQDTSVVVFDAMMETLQKTTLGTISEGDRVNIERSAKFGDEVGGHVISGHVHGKAEIDAIERPENNHIITFKASPELLKFILDKGFIALNGASLTVVSLDREKNTFQVYLIPETLERTTFGEKNVGDFVNVEVDQMTRAVVETVERVMGENSK